MHTYFNWIWFHPQITMISANSHLAAGIFGIVLGTAILVLSYSRSQWRLAITLPRKKVRMELCILREKDFDLSSQQTWQVGVTSPSFILILDILLFASVLVFTCVSWTGYIKNLRLFAPENKFWMPQHHVNHTIDISQRDFGGTGKYTWEAWNCQLQYRTMNGAGRKVVTSHQVWLSCRLQEATRDLIMGLLGVLTLRLALIILLWWQNRATARQEREGSDVETVMAKKKTFEESSRSSASRRSMQGESIKEAPPPSLYEMPAHRMSRVEMEDAHYREMEGDGAERELAGPEVAVEAPDSETRRISVKEG